MDFASAINTKHFFRFTGPPEHWLTAIKFMTWGLEAKYKPQWKKIQTGDVFFIHSTGPTKEFPNSLSGIIGIGIIGYHFSIKDNLLWHYEIKNHENRWPLLVPLSEIYLFSEIPDPVAWEPPRPENDTTTLELINKLVKNVVPLSSVKGFPQMGSFSSVQSEVAKQILFQERPLYLYSGHSTRGSVFEELSNFIEVHNATETLRHAASLRFLEKISQRIIKKPYSLVERDNDILARAEAAHFSIIENLIHIFRNKGYDTLSNKQVDLFAHDETRSFLFEVKSTENRNFRRQARKGIIQLYEYDYFEINKFKEEKNINFKDQYRILVPSREPKDIGYINFINSLNLGIAMASEKKLRPVGKDLGFTKI